jgi:hypothetical protein
MTKNGLNTTAGIVWLAIGGMLATRGALTLLKAQEGGATTTGLACAALLGLVIGAAKGRFVLSKTARRNARRIAGLEEPVKPWQVFAPAFYPLILVMMGLGFGLRAAAAKGYAGGHLTYGGVLVGIGCALFVSAFTYWKAEEQSEEQGAVEA